MLELANLSHVYANGTRALDDVTLSIPTGMYGLLGPNGAGKSTLMIAPLLQQIGGRRYAPLNLAPEHPGLYRIDRFTVRAVKPVWPGSRVSQRGGELTVHVVDLIEMDAVHE